MIAAGEHLAVTVDYATAELGRVQYLTGREIFAVWPLSIVVRPIVHRRLGLGIRRDVLHGSAAFAADGALGGTPLRGVVVNGSISA